jgi:hypothetical protein
MLGVDAAAVVLLARRTSRRSRRRHRALCCMSALLLRAVVGDGERLEEWKGWRCRQGPGVLRGCEEGARERVSAALLPDVQVWRTARGSDSLLCCCLEESGGVCKGDAAALLCDVERRGLKEFNTRETLPCCLMCEGEAGKRGCALLKGLRQPSGATITLNIAL